MGAAGKAWIFYGANQLKLLPAFSAIGDRVTLVPISRPGTNSLDFHLVFYLGHLAAKSPESEFTVLSKDKGYDPAIKHAQMLKFAVRRIAGLQPAAKAKMSAPAKKAAPAAKTVPAGPAAKKKPAAAPKKTAKKVAPKSAAATAAKKTAPAARGKPKPARAVGTAPVPVKPTPAKVAAKKASVTIYDKVLKDLKGRGRPTTLAALVRHIQSKIGESATPAKIQVLLNRLKNARVVHVVDGQLSYVVD